MDIEGAKNLKAETELAIRDLLLGFSNATGLAVDGVRFEMLEVFGGDRRFKCTSVELDVRLP